jgi:4-amino-4-deoxychorismate lyase
MSFFETIKIQDSEPMHLEYHQKRYESVLSHFNKKDFKTLKDYIDAPKNGLYRCRLVYTPDDIDNIKVEYFEYKKRDVRTLKIIHDNEIEYTLKSTNRTALDELFLKREDAQDILIVKDNLITDTTIANIAFFDGIWKTPRTPLLKGTTRQRLLEASQIYEADIRVEAIQGFSKVALFNAMIDFDIIVDENIKDAFC